MKHIRNSTLSQSPIVHFANYEVLQNESDKIFRQKALFKAAVLGNGEHYEVKIVYVDDHEEEAFLEAIIMMTSGDYIEVIGGIDIPIRCILRVE